MTATVPVIEKEQGATGVPPKQVKYLNTSLKFLNLRVQLLNVFHDSVVHRLFVANVVVLRCLLREASCFVASKSTRENYGGSVSVERVDREQRGSKNYSRNTSRGFRDRGSSGDRGRLRRR